jgi:hypothetical protein
LSKGTMLRFDELTAHGGLAADHGRHATMAR